MKIRLGAISTLPSCFLENSSLFLWLEHVEKYTCVFWSPLTAQMSLTDPNLDFIQLHH